MNTTEQSSGAFRARRNECLREGRVRLLPLLELPLLCLGLVELVLDALVESTYTVILLPGGHLFGALRVAVGFGLGVRSTLDEYVVPENTCE